MITIDDDEFKFMLDIRDVLQRQKDKSYITLGEAFEDLFYDAGFDIRDGHLVVIFEE